MNNSKAHSQLVHDTWALLGQVKGLVCWKTNGSVRDDDFRRALPQGWSDLFVLFDGGNCAFLECKTGRSKLNDNQEAFASIIRMHHGQYWVIRSAQEGLDLCIKLMGGSVQMTDGINTWVESRR